MESYRADTKETQGSGGAVPLEELRGPGKEGAGPRGPEAAGVTLQGTGCPLSRAQASNRLNTLASV